MNSTASAHDNLLKKRLRSFPPIVDRNARVLVLGTMPGPAALPSTSPAHAAAGFRSKLEKWEAVKRWAQGLPEAGKNPALAKKDGGWFVYLLRCSDGTLYTGVTTDPARRLREHNAGRGGAYTRSRRPGRILFVESCSGRSAALKREWEIKGWSRAEKKRWALSGRAA